jgi:hypothetical protein
VLVHGSRLPLSRLTETFGKKMKRLATFSIGCMVLFAGCARVEIPQFTSVTCSADPVGSPVTSVRKIRELSKVLRTLPGGWKQVRDEPMKVGLAVVLKRDSHAVAQVVIGEDWVSIQVADDRGPHMNAPIFTKHITAADREQIFRLATEKPNQ